MPPVRKYRNEPTVIDGIRFASKREARRYQELKLLERAGEITGLRLQPRFPLKVEGKLICTYVADFAYAREPMALETIEDVKGVQTPEFKIKRKLFEALYGVELVLT